MNKSSSVSIKQIIEAAENSNDGSITIISGESADVQGIVEQMINNDSIIDSDDVEEIVDNKLEDYTTTADLQNDYTTKTLLNNTLDNYASKELLTQSLSDKANYTTTDALESTATNHENRIKGLEDNFVSTTTLTESLATKADSNHNHDSSYASINHNHDSSYAGLSHSHLIGDLSYDNNTSLKSVIDDKASSSHNHDSSYASSSHTHTTSDITDYTAYDVSNCAKLNTANTFTEPQLINVSDINVYSRPLKIL